MKNLASSLEWVAGFMEGEGSFCNTSSTCATVVCAAAQVQKWPLELLHARFGGTLRLCVSKNPNQQDKWQWHLVGIRGAGLMMTLYPLMSPKRQAQIQKTLAFWKTRPAHVQHRHTCVNGHPLAGENLLIDSRGSRACRTCRRTQGRAWWARKTAKRVA